MFKFVFFLATAFVVSRGQMRGLRSPAVLKYFRNKLPMVVTRDVMRLVFNEYANAVCEIQKQKSVLRSDLDVCNKTDHFFRRVMSRRNAWDFLELEEVTQRNCNITKQSVWTTCSASMGPICQSRMLELCPNNDTRGLRALFSSRDVPDFFNFFMLDQSLSQVYANIKLAYSDSFEFGRQIGVYVNQLNHYLGDFEKIIRIAKSNMQLIAQYSDGSVSSSFDSESICSIAAESKLDISDTSSTNFKLPSAMRNYYNSPNNRASLAKYARLRYQSFPDFFQCGTTEELAATCLKAHRFTRKCSELLNISGCQDYARNRHNLIRKLKHENFRALADFVSAQALEEMQIDFRKHTWVARRLPKNDFFHISMITLIDEEMPNGVEVNLTIINETTKERLLFESLSATLARRVMTKIKSEPERGYFTFV